MLLLYRQTAQGPFACRLAKVLRKISLGQRECDMMEVSIYRRCSGCLRGFVGYAC